MDSLPVEMLVEIFNLCLPQTDFIIPNLTEAPLLLCNVCQSWRQIALSRPSLWSSLALNFNHRSVPRLADLYRRWLARAAGSMLFLRVFCEEDYGPRAIIYPAHQGPAAESLLQLIKGLSSQCRSLDIHFFREDMQIIGVEEGTFPSLTKLAIRAFPSGLAGTVPSSSIPAFCDSARGSSFNRGLTIIPWAQLTIFHGDFNLSQCLTFLHKAVNLVECTPLICSSAQWRPLPSLPATPIYHFPKLVSLTLRDSSVDPSHVFNILCCLSLPVLTDLYLEWLMSFDVSKFISFALRSTSCLPTLSLHASPICITEADLFQCLQAVPSLMDLQLYGPHLTSIFYGYLTHHADFLPNLESLRSYSWPIRDSQMIGVLPILADMLSSRWHPEKRSESARLKSFHLDTRLWISDYTPALSSRLADLCRDGMKLSIEDKRGFFFPAVLRRRRRSEEEEEDEDEDAEEMTIDGE